jgi:hypothetical protein
MWTQKRGGIGFLLKYKYRADSFRPVVMRKDCLQFNDDLNSPTLIVNAIFSAEVNIFERIVI